MFATNPTTKVKSLKIIGTSRNCDVPCGQWPCPKANFFFLFSVLDQLICHLWHSQWCFWMSMLISIWNLVLIAFERFLAVCKPLKHQNLTSKFLFCWKEKNILMSLCYMFCSVKKLFHAVGVTWKMIGLLYLCGQFVLALGLVLASIKVQTKWCVSVGF